MKEKLKAVSPYKLILLAGLVLLCVLNFSSLTSLVKKVLDVISPILVGFFLALIVNLLLKRIEKIYFPNSQAKWVQKSRRPVSLLLSLVVIVIALVLVIYLVIPELVKVVVDLVDSLQIFFAGLERNIQDWQIHFPQLLDILDQFNISEENLASLGKKAADQLLGVGSNLVMSTFNTAGSIVSVVLDSLVSIMVAVYLLGSKEKIKEEVTSFLGYRLKKETYTSISKTLKLSYKVFDDFFTGQLVEAVVTGVMVYIGMLILRLPHAMTIATMTGVLAILPMIGPILAGAIGFLLIALQNPNQGLVFLIFIIVVQQIEGNIIYPRLIGSQIGLPSLWVLVAVTVGGGLLGIFGTVLMVPVFATIYKLIQNYTSYHQDKEQGLDMTGRHWVDG